MDRLMGMGGSGARDRGGCGWQRELSNAAVAGILIGQP